MPGDHHDDDHDLADNNHDNHDDDDDDDDDFALQSHLVLTLLPRLGDPAAALGSVGIIPFPIRGELFGQVDVPRRPPPGPSMDPPMAILGQELPMVFAGWLWLWLWLWL